MSLNPLDIPSGFFGMGEDKSRVLFRGRARVFFALMQGTAQQTTYRDVGLLAELVVRAETVVRRDALFREQARAVDVEVRIALLQNAPTERAVLALSNQLCKCKIRFEVDAANENLIEREEIDFENIFLLPSDEIGIDYETRIGFRFVERMSWRKYLEKFQYGSRPSITLLTPSDNAVAINSSVVFSWNAVATFLDYTLEVSTNATFTTLVHTSTATTTSRTVVLENGRRYWWRVVATNSSETLVSSIRTFTTRLTAPILTGFPTSAEVPTSSFFQGVAQRGVGNETATEVEFEWNVGVTPQSNVTAFYNSSGNATGIFNLPSITAPTLIKVRARSKNSVVIGDWSNYVNIDVTLFRPTPNFTSFTASTDVVALQADPTEIVQFNLVASYPQDIFGGTLSFKIVRVDTDTTIGSGNTTVNTSGATPITLSATFDITNTVTSQSPIQFKAVITRPDGVEFDSNTITVSFVPRPSLTDVRWFLNPHQNAFQDVSETTLATNVNNPVAKWRSSHGNTTLYVEQNNAGNRPVIDMINNRLCVRVGAGLFLIRPTQSSTATQFALSSAAARKKFTVIMVSDFPRGFNVQGNVCSFKRADGGENIVSFGQQESNGVLGFRFGAIRTGVIQPSVTIFPVGVATAIVTYDGDINPSTGNSRASLYRNSVFLASSGNAGSPIQAEVADAGLGVNTAIFTSDSGTATSLGDQDRRIGHIIIIEKVLSVTEMDEWFAWLQAIYKYNT